LARRPDLISAADQIVAADHSLASARAAFLPDITLSPEIVTSAGGLQFSGTMWSVGGSLLAPIFVGGQLRANADIAASERDQAAWAYRAASLAAFAEVENALAAITRLAEQEQAAARLLDDNDRTLRDTKHRNSVGYTDYLTVLDAERTSLSSALDLIQIRAARLSQAATLYQAIGGG
ncbi:TolC family protein, partial [Endobacter medicaginis]